MINEIMPIMIIEIENSIENKSHIHILFTFLSIGLINGLIWTSQVLDNWFSKQKKKKERKKMKRRKKKKTVQGYYFSEVCVNVTKLLATFVQLP